MLRDPYHRSSDSGDKCGLSKFNPEAGDKPKQDSRADNAASGHAATAGQTRNLALGGHYLAG
jgi:hypothetical protein